MSGDSLASLNQLGLKVRKQNKTFDAYAIAQLWQKQVFGALTITQLMQTWSLWLMNGKIDTPLCYIYIFYMWLRWLPEHMTVQTVKVKHHLK